jgi:nitric oxide reductase activation protein
LTTRILILTGWLLLAVAGVTYHLTAGPSQEKLDLAAVRVRDAEKAASEQDYAEAVQKYEQALAALPEGKKAEARTIRLEKAKAQMLAKQLPDAHGDLKMLVEELAADPSADAKQLAEARSAMANANYYMTWLMRLEGLPRETWEPEVEAARQTYKLLAEQAEQAGNADEAKKHKEDLESSVRLARMDLGELQGLPLPSQ